MGCAGKGDRAGLSLAAVGIPPSVDFFKFDAAGPQFLCLQGDSGGLTQGHVFLLLLTQVLCLIMCASAC